MSEERVQTSKRRDTGGNAERKSGELCDDNAQRNAQFSHWRDWTRSLPPKSSGASTTQKYARARLDAGLFTQEQYDEFVTDDANAGDENMGGEETMDGDGMMHESPSIIRAGPSPLPASQCYEGNECCAECRRQYARVTSALQSASSE